MAFAIVGARTVPDLDLGSSTVSGRRATIGLQCQQCYLGASTNALFGRPSSLNDFNTVHLQNLAREGTSLPNHDWTIGTFHPRPEPVRIPEYLPEVVERAFRQGESNLQNPDHEEAATTMFRRALDVGLKIKFPDLKGDLRPRIRKLAEQHVIPTSLADWAHQVRMIGNDGAHDLEGCTPEDAKAARDFVDAVLRYLFSLPGMIEARRPIPEDAVVEPEALSAG